MRRGREAWGSVARVGETTNIRDRVSSELRPTDLVGNSTDANFRDQNDGPATCGTSLLHRRYLRAVLTEQDFVLQKINDSYKLSLTSADPGVAFVIPNAAR